MNKPLVGLLSLIVAILVAPWSGGDSAVLAANQDLIDHRVADIQETGSLKLSLTVEVQLIDERLPNEGELGAVSQYLLNQFPAHNKTFVTFYLPGMEHGAGAFATAHHTPEMQVKVLAFMLAQYPQYAKFAE